MQEEFEAGSNALSMRRLDRSFFMVAVALALFVSTGGAYSATPSTPAYVRSADVNLLVGTEYAVSCSLDGEVLDGFFMGVSDRSGHGWGQVSGNLDGPLVRIAVAGTHHELGPDLQASSSASFSMGGRVPGGPGKLESLRVAWAVWGDPIDCLFTIGGEPFPYVEQPVTSAVRLAASDFDMGIGVDTAGASAALGQRFERSARGELWAWIRGGYGTATADGPAGERYTAQGLPGTGPTAREISLGVYSRDTDGQWVYGLPAAAGFISGPRLHIINVDFGDAG